MAEQFLDNVVADLPALDRADAACMADAIIDQIIIPALQRDRANLTRTRLSWELVFAESRQRTAEFLAVRIQDHVARADVERIISWRG